LESANTMRFTAKVRGILSPRKQKLTSILSPLLVKISTNISRYSEDNPIMHELLRHPANCSFQVTYHEFLHGFFRKFLKELDHSRLKQIFVHLFMCNLQIYISSKGYTYFVQKAVNRNELLSLVAKVFETTEDEIMKIYVRLKTVDTKFLFPRAYSEISRIVGKKEDVTEMVEFSSSAFDVYMRSMEESRRQLEARMNMSDTTAGNREG
jgi:hypothetical protein